MEGLKKLEVLQRTMTMMESLGVIVSDNKEASLPSEQPDDSLRFIANFTLFLLQPCGELSINDRCRLISDHLPKISAAVLEERLNLQHRENDSKVCLHSPDGGVRVGDELSLTDFKDLGFIGMDAMQRANSTLEDFCRSYFMFHGMDVNRPDSIFRFLPVLSFTESYIYQLDRMNEKLLSKPSAVDEVRQVGKYAICDRRRVWESDPFIPLVVLLEQCGLLTERMKAELKSGEEYWKLERKLCGGQLTNKLEITVEDVKRAIHLKSFDYRVLNLLLYQLSREEVNEVHMEFLSASELLVEIADDLFDYEEDVLENNFNILRMFVRLYGTSMAPTMLAKYIAEAEEKYCCLLKALDPELSSKYQRRCEEATREGGNSTGHPLGSWTIPPLIGDEEFYRSANAPDALL